MATVMHVDGSAREEWGSVEGDHLLCHFDGSACGEWGSRGGPSVVSYILMVVHVGSGGVEGDHLWYHIVGIGSSWGGHLCCHGWSRGTIHSAMHSPTRGPSMARGDHAHIAL